MGNNTRIEWADDTRNLWSFGVLLLVAAFAECNAVRNVKA